MSKMRLLYFILFFLSFSSVSAQTQKSDINKTELETSFFDEDVFRRMEAQKRKFAIKNPMLSTLYCVAIYNSNIGKLIKDVAIRSKFEFRQNTIVAVNYFIYNVKTNVATDFQTIKSGVLISKRIGRPWQCYGDYQYQVCYSVELVQYKNSKKNGLSCSWHHGSDSSEIIRRYYSENKPVCKYYRYQLGKLVEEGDSLQANNFQKVKVPRYNDMGEIAEYITMETFDEKKKGVWKYYDIDGTLIKQETYE